MKPFKLTFLNKFDQIETRQIRGETERLAWGYLANDTEIRKIISAEIEYDLMAQELVQFITYRENERCQKRIAETLRRCRLNRNLYAERH